MAVSAAAAAAHSVEEENGTGFNRALFERHVKELFTDNTDPEKGPVKRGGHMARWVYGDFPRGGNLNTGSRLWTAWVNASIAGNNGYYLTKQEIELIRDSAAFSKIRDKYNGAVNLVDFGSGSPYAFENKIWPFLAGLPDIVRYMPLDISKIMLDQVVAVARQRISAADKDIIVDPIHGDFSTGKAPPGEASSITLPEGNNLGLFLGSTVTNMEADIGQPFPRDQVVKKLRKLGKILNNGNEEELTGEHGLIIGYDANLDKKSAEAAYLDTSDIMIWGPLVTGVMLDVKRALNPRGDFDPQGFHHEKVIEQGPPVDPDDPDGPPQYIVIHQCVVADQEQDFTIGDNGSQKRFVITPDDPPLVIKNNYKFHPKFLRQLGREAAFIPDQPITLKRQDNTAVLQPLKLHI